MLDAVRCALRLLSVEVCDQTSEFIALQWNLFTLGMNQSYFVFNDPTITDAQARANVDAVATSLMSAVISLVRIQRTAHRTLSCACSHSGQGVMPIIRSTRNGAAGIIAERLNQLLADYLTDHPHTVT